jgi:hypothetical protein
MEQGIDVVRLASGPTGYSDVAYLRSTSDWNFTTKMSLRLKEFVRNEEVDLVHIIGGFPESGILREQEVPVVYQFFGGSLYELDRSPSLFQKLRGFGKEYRASWIATRTIKNVDQFIVHSETAIPSLVERYSVNRSAVKVVPIATDDLFGEFNASDSASKGTVLVLCDSNSTEMVLRSFGGMQLLHLEQPSVRFRILCDYSSYFTVLRTIKAEGIDSFVDCIECRASDDFSHECFESVGVVVPRMLLSRNRLIAEARMLGAPIVHLVSAPTEDISNCFGVDVLTLNDAANYFFDESLSKQSSSYDTKIYSWDRALFAIVKMYSDLIEQ